MHLFSLFKKFYLIKNLLIFITIFIFKINPLNAEPLRIAVAANFTPVLKNLLDEFHAKTNIRTQVISGATGAMFIQIQHGAPFDIFLAADSVRPMLLEQKGLTIPNSRKTYALGQLAFFSMNEEISLETLRKSTGENEKFAIANPDSAPYGEAAKQTLEYLDLWPKILSQLIIGINVNQTFAQVRSQAVKSGLIANSQLILNDLQGQVIPSHYHQPIIQELVIIKKSNNIYDAKKLSEYLLSKEIQKKIVTYGYAKFEQLQHD